MKVFHTSTGWVALLWLAALLTAANPTIAAEGHTVAGFRVPAGWAVEKVAGSPLIKYPQFACFDDRGRLFVAEGTGKNLPGPAIVPLKLGTISMLEDTDGDGRFDKRTVFADGLIFAAGVQWHAGSVYVASHPAIWKLTDTDDDGRADERQELVGKFGFNGNGCDIHGPFLQPDGWLYWTQGRHGYRVHTPDGRHLEGLAARVWRCRLDGSGVERVAGGGYDNTVELAFTETADLAGTMDQYPGDMLLQYVDGGVYPRPDEPTLAEFPRTGPLLPPIAGFSAAYPAALCGLVRLRSDHFGPGHRGTLLTTQFNVRRVQQHTLTHNGAELRSINKNFLVSTDWDFHPTDVLEDADGSLLMVDMGSWFNFDCPTQKIAKAEVTGSIYRIRRIAAPRLDDPWGQTIGWSALQPARLVELLGDTRFKVSARAGEELVARGAAAVPALAAFVASQAAGDSLARREAVYLLSRIGTPEARAAVRAALVHQDADTREVAAHCVSVERDAQALPALLRMVVDDSPPQRRKAAEGLGRIGQPEAVPALLDSLRRGADDPFLKHSLIYALIRIGAFDATLAALDDALPRVRAAGLIALDQMHGTEQKTAQRSGGGPASQNPYRGDTFRYAANDQLTRRQVAPLLTVADPALELALLETISHHPTWSEELLIVAGRCVHSPKPDARQHEALMAALLASAADAKVQQFIADALADAAIAEPTRRMLLGLLARSRVAPLPRPWLDAIQQILHGNDAAMMREALNVISTRRLTSFDKLLTELSNRSDVPADVRVAATAVLAPRTTLDAAAFDRLTAQLTAAGDPLLAVGAAAALGTARLNADQRRALIEHIAVAGPLTAPLLIKAFYGTRDPATGVALAKALVRSPGGRALPPDELEQIFGERLAPDVRAAVQPLLDQHQQTHAEQAQYLAELGEKMSAAAADVRRGEQVFFSKEAKCSACHVVNGRGGNFGPDLSRIGSIRITRALLESIVFPSATIVPDFRSYNIVTTDGRVVAGQIARETSDAIFLRTAALTETRIARADVESIDPSEVSFMPQGLEKTMTPQQLNDLLEYLYSLK